LHQSVTTALRRDFSALKRDLTVQQALDEIRLHGIGEKIVYFYVVGAEGRLDGVVPTRRLLTAPLDKKLADLMITHVATIVSGALCALLASSFEVTLAKSIILAFFLTMALGLGESVSVQSMTLAIQALRTIRPTFSWYMRAFLREMAIAGLLGGACALLVGGIVWFWYDTMVTAISIGLSIFLALAMACILGLSVPTLLHALRQDPKIAAGPLTLALTDLVTLSFYFGMAWWLL